MAFAHSNYGCGATRYQRNTLSVPDSKSAQPVQLPLVCQANMNHISPPAHNIVPLVTLLKTETIEEDDDGAQGEENNEETERADDVAESKVEN